MTPFPVPCPICGGLVAKPSCRCTQCGAQWSQPLEMFFDGLCVSSERAYKIAACQEWGNIEQACQGMQDVQDALSMRSKYQIEIEKLERNRR